MRLGQPLYGHHGTEYKVPDYRIYKVENAPELMNVQRALKSVGLKDPWLRNEVWRYNRNEFGTTSSRIKATLGRGFKWGFGAFVATIALTEVYDRMFPSQHDHDHGHH